MTAVSQPALTVILPVRNGMPYLPRAVASVLTQTWSDLELLVIDDGSDDDTRTYLATLEDPRVRVLDAGGRGLATALNLGLDAARAPYVARQDADDWSAPSRLASQMTWLVKRPAIDVLATPVHFVDATDRPVDNAWTRRIRAQWDAATTPAQIAALMPLTCCVFHATVLARTDVLRRAGGYDAAMVPAEDYDLWLRLLPHARFARHPDALYTVRVHEASSSRRHRADQIDRVVAAKLRFLRRVAAGLAPHPTITMPCADRGALIFARVAPREGFVVHGRDTSRTERAADVVAVTDFSTLDRFAAVLTRKGRYLQVGNLFVRADVVGPMQGGPQPPRTDLEPESSLHGV